MCMRRQQALTWRQIRFYEEIHLLFEVNYAGIMVFQPIFVRNEPLIDATTSEQMLFQDLISPTTEFCRHS